MAHMGVAIINLYPLYVFVRISVLWNVFCRASVSLHIYLIGLNRGFECHMNRIQSENYFWLQCRTIVLYPYQGIIPLSS